MHHQRGLHMWVYTSSVKQSVLPVGRCPGKSNLSFFLSFSPSLSLSLLQMNRPIQVKPADSESRGGTVETLFLPPSHTHKHTLTHTHTHSHTHTHTHTFSQTNSCRHVFTYVHTQKQTHTGSEITWATC